MQNNETPLSDYLILAALMGIAALFAVTVLQHQSLRLDEAQSLWQTSHSFRHILQIVSEDVHVPFYHMLLGAWQRYVGTGIFTGRILSLLFFIASIPAMYALGKTTYDRTVGLFAALLVTVSPFLNWYGSEIRMYSLLTGITILHQYAFVTFLHPNTAPKRMLFFVTSVIGIFTHYFFWLILAAEACVFVLRFRRWSTQDKHAFYTTAAVLCLLFAPWIWYVLHNGGNENTQPALVSPTLINVYNTISEFLFGYQADHLSTLLISLWPLAALLAFVALQHRTKSAVPATQYLLCCLCIPLAAAFVVSLILTPLFAARYLIIAAPALYLLLAVLIAAYPPRLRRAAQVTLVAVMIATLAHQTYSSTTPVKENYAAAAAYLEQHAEPQDVALATAPFTIYPLEYYYHGSARLSTIPEWDRFALGPIPPFSVPALEAQLAQLAATYQTMWVVMSYDQGYAEELRLYLDTHYERLVAEQFSPDLFLYRYKLRY